MIMIASAHDDLGHLHHLQHLCPLFKLLTSENDTYSI